MEDYRVHIVFPEMHSDRTSIRRSSRFNFCLRTSHCLTSFVIGFSKLFICGPIMGLDNSCSSEEPWRSSSCRCQVCRICLAVMGRVTRAFGETECTRVTGILSMCSLNSIYRSTTDLVFFMIVLSNETKVFCEIHLYLLVHELFIRMELTILYSVLRFLSLLHTSVNMYNNHVHPRTPSFPSTISTIISAAHPQPVHSSSPDSSSGSSSFSPHSGSVRPISSAQTWPRCRRCLGWKKTLRA